MKEAWRNERDEKRKMLPTRNRSSKSNVQIEIQKHSKVLKLKAGVYGFRIIVKHVLNWSVHIMTCFAYM